MRSRERAAISMRGRHAHAGHDHETMMKNGLASCACDAVSASLVNLQAATVSASLRVTPRREARRRGEMTTKIDRWRSGWRPRWP